MSLRIESRLGKIEAEIKEIKRKMYYSRSKKISSGLQADGKLLIQKN